MKLSLKTIQNRKGDRGWALLMVMTLAGCAVMVMASVMSWARENAALVSRNNEYFATTYAAEAATEKVLASLSSQYQNYGFPGVNQNMSSYTSLVPAAADGSYWSSYQFSGGTTANKVIITNTATSQQVLMNAPYNGLTMMANTYEIIANARNTNSMNQIVSTIGQQIYLGTIPLFQFAIFYQNTMEIAPGAAMTVTGPVHGNAYNYLQPQDGLTLLGPWSAVGSNVLGENPLDPTSRTPSGVSFEYTPQNNVTPLNMPIGTNTTGTISNTSQNAYAVLELPQPGQGPTSATGTNLLYNRADMIILVSNNSISVTSGAIVNNQATVVSNNQYSSWLSTNGSFYDQRDNLTVNPVVINVSNLMNWTTQTTNPLYSALSTTHGNGYGSVESIYVADLRSTSNSSISSNAIISTNYVYGTNYSTNSVVGSLPSPGSYIPPITRTNSTTDTSQSLPGLGSYIGSIITNNGHPKTYTFNLISSYTYNVLVTTPYTNTVVSTNMSYLTNWTTTSQPGIVLTNGAVLPPQGLAIATPDPAYIIGNWNTQSNYTGSPSDAGQNSTTYTLPSAIYSDAITILSPSWNSASSAQPIANRVASSDTVNAAFLTGNVPSNGTYYSGGVENFPRFLEDWGGQTFTYNGSLVCMFSSQIADYPWPGTGTVYNPPTRNWAFDNNFNNPTKQPPMMPQVIVVQKSKWVTLAPNTTSF